MPAVTTASVIGLQWQEPAQSGGEPIDDYRIYYDESTANWVELVSGLTDLSFTTTDLI